MPAGSQNFGKICGPMVCMSQKIFGIVFVSLVPLINLLTKQRSFRSFVNRFPPPCRQMDTLDLFQQVGVVSYIVIIYYIY